MSENDENLILSMMVTRATKPELQKMIEDKEKSIPLLEEQIKFCKNAITIFKKELEKRD